MVGDGGLCASSESDKSKIMAALNLAQETLLKRLDSKGVLTRWCRPVWGGCFALPSDCYAVRQAWLNGRTMQMRDEWWEGQLSVGIQSDAPAWFGGSGVLTCYGNENLVDMGEEYPIPNPWPSHKNVKLSIVAESPGDAGKEVLVRYLDVYGHQQDEALVLKGDSQPVWTAQNVSDVVNISKPVTNGGLRLFIRYDWHDEGRSRQIAWIAPEVTSPRWRRMKVPGRFPTGCNGTILLKGKQRFVPLTKETDLLFISDKQALRFGVQALAAQERKDPQEYNTYIQFAVNELEKELADSSSAAASGQIQFNSGLRMPRRGWA